MLGVGDVDYMDPNLSYYAIGYLNLRLWSRQLYTYPATAGQTTAIAPDLATAMPAISDGGLRYAVTIRTGSMWNTRPPRQVTAADVVRGVKRSCNPTAPFGGQPDYSDILTGYSAFCAGFAAVSSTDVGAQAAYTDNHDISGVSVDPSNPLTVDFTLTKPAIYFTDLLSLAPFAPAPVEYLTFLPGSNALAQHTISDGPYEVQSYIPSRSITYVRNPAWRSSTDPIRKAYVDEVRVTETGNQAAIEQQILANTSSADMGWDSTVPTVDIPGLASDPRLVLGKTYGSDPYVLFNVQSPNNHRALSKLQVRQALEYAMNRSQLIQDVGGPNLAPPLTQVLPPGVAGSEPAYDMYPYDPGKAKSLLAAAGYSGLTLKLLYRSAESTSMRLFETIQAELAPIGIHVVGVGAPSADFYTRYLQQPSTARAGVWDLSLLGWGPDWYGNAAKSFFEPLFDGRALPPTSSDFGLFSDPVLNNIIDRALAAPTSSEASALWHQADVETMSQAPFLPVASSSTPLLHGTQVHNCNFVPELENCDPTNVWVSG